MLKIVFSLMLLLFFNYSPSVEAANFVCGQDLNSNGYLGDEGEYTSCKEATIKNSVPAGQFCLSGFTMMPNGTCMKYEYSPLHDQCPKGSFVQNGRCVTIEQIKPTAYCPTGYVVSGDYCVKISWVPQTTSCPAGSFIQNGRCISQTQIQPTQQCPQGTNFGSPWGQCGVPTGQPCFDVIGAFQGHPNFRGAYPFPTQYTCLIVLNPDTICPSGTLSGNTCIVNKDVGPVSTSCPSGYIPENGQCKKVEQTYQNYLCSTGTLKNGSCEVIKDMGAVQAVCPVGTVIENGQCKKSTQSDIQYSCTKGTLSGTNCIWNTKEQYCPIALDSTCLANNGGASCSPNKCIDIDIEKPIDEGNVTGDMLVNDGKTSEDGLCLDQMFIFNGRAQDCKKPGVSNAFKDCCKSEGKSLSDDAGSLMSAAQTMSTVSHVYSAASEAYTAYNAAIQAGQTATAAMNSGIAAAQNYMMVAFDPTTLAISAAIFVVMKYLATGCDQMSMETALMSDSGFCHEVGTYCKKKIKLIGCVQKAKSYCCFNSKLARIIHEQGRPQLKTGINNWGTPEAPLCRGFTPEEFQSVDFGKIDLTEYINDVQKNATEEIQKNMSNITSDFLQQVN
ncbi:conjugative transfer protein [Aeromonas caviae]|uniref:Conjugative transfer protein n=1 Tax=Aeromonas caviae TaxID=648 RepID=A0ABD0B8C0_AERCA|nr:MULTISPECIES: conjugal transfer protein TraN [Aeromonas]BCK65875.1 conjugative transfer protein [Aeromonas hydrophila]BCR31466.1 conjugative transfer protein [Aeromonas caviae]GJA71866.1 conjugative transfer protein [Aeromonas caviae]GJA81661.1 conjugative transfer protein [Aeromonas caviae]GJB00153.1 conjugative transfer protein [Aeromonas caviae]